MIRSIACLALVIAAAACGSSPISGDQDGGGSGCPTGIDNDGDGHGNGCAAGPDCDDGDPTLFQDCCLDTDPHEGCACEPGVDNPVTCFDGSAMQAATPPCMRGTRSCDPGTSLWTPCVGQVKPEEESCDTVDNDCDGTVDDGVLSMCGDCTPGCDTTGAGGLPFPLPGDPLPPGVVDVGADGVGLDPNGDLVLDEDAITFNFLWIANDPEGTVSKLDTVTGKEVARYATVTHDATAVVSVDGAPSAAVPAWNSGQNHPSRTAVDFYGNVWVGNRAFGVQPSATKIMNDLADCTDRNGNGMIDTSSDVNANGVINVADPAEFKGEQDECIKFTVAMGAPQAAGARALAIDSGSAAGDPGHAWVGLFSEQAFYQLDGKTGQKIKRVPPTGGMGVSPYGAAIDGVGRLWAPHGAGGVGTIIGIDTVTGNIVQSPIGQVGIARTGSYGIAIDQQNRVWLGGWGNATALRFDPATQLWAEADVPGYVDNGWGTRGIGADALGNVWLCIHTTSAPGGFYQQGVMARINTTTLAHTGTWDLNTSNDGDPVGAAIGCAVDFDGNVWSANQTTSNASRLYVDPVTHEPAVNPATGHMVDSFPTGPNPYTYSDFTGFGLRNITRPSGDYVVVMEGCDDMDRAHWTEVSWDATVPAGTSVEVWVRTGDDPATIASQQQYGPWLVSAANLQAPPGPVPDGRYMELTIRLISIDRTTTPIVHAYDVKWACPQIPID